MAIRFQGHPWIRVEGRKHMSSQPHHSTHCLLEFYKDGIEYSAYGNLMFELFGTLDGTLDTHPLTQAESQYCAIEYHRSFKLDTLWDGGPWGKAR